MKVSWHSLLSHRVRLYRRQQRVWRMALQGLQRLGALLPLPMGLRLEHKQA